MNLWEFKEVGEAFGGDLLPCLNLKSVELTELFLERDFKLLGKADVIFEGEYWLKSSFSPLYLKIPSGSNSVLIGHLKFDLIKYSCEIDNDWNSGKDEGVLNLPFWTSSTL